MTILSMDAPLPSRIKGWIDERFPFVNGVLFFALYLTAAALSRFVSESGELSLSLMDLVGCLVTWSFFLVIRIFDEHKDYDLDVLNHPQRVLQSGLITLNHLKVLAIVALVVQVAYGFYLDSGFGDVLRAWLLMFGWTCLMGKEFFCGEWLEKRLTLYAFSHMLVMPLIVWWLVQMGHPGAPLTIEIQAMMLLAFVSGFAFEITRKTRGPEEERETVDSYSRIFGAKGSARIVVALVIVMVVIQAYLVYAVGGWSYWPALLVLVLVLSAALKSLFAFIAEPSLAGREKNELTMALATLVGYLALVISLYVSRGLALSLMGGV